MATLVNGTVKWFNKAKKVMDLSSKKMVEKMYLYIIETSIILDMEEFH